MDILIQPKKLRGSVRAISSKSEAHRLLICAAFGDKPTNLNINILSQDILATIDCLQALGANITRAGDNFLVEPIVKIEGVPKLNCKESGSTLRFILPVATSLYGEVEFTGEGRLPERPLNELMDSLRAKGIQFSSNSLPFTTKGLLKAGEYTVEGNVSSQYITGLLLALAVVEGENEIVLSSPLVSSAYVDITIKALKAFGVYVKQGAKGYKLKGKSKIASPQNIVVDGDWSNGAFFVVANALNNDIALEGLSDNSPQGDKKIVDFVKAFGVNVPENKGVYTKGEGDLQGTMIDIDATPDLLPILAVLASCAKGKTEFVNGARLRAKESDRLLSTAAMINALGGNAQQLENGLVVTGGTLKGGTVYGYNDHRIVMAAAIAASVCKEPVIIKGFEAVNKSYPTFFDDYISLGGVANEL